MEQIAMISKAITTFLVSLVATSGFSWLLSMACQRTGGAETMSPDSAVTAPGSSELAGLTLVNAYPKLKFEAPVEYTYADDGTNRVFVVEQAGQIRVFDNNADASSASTYLDIRSRVAYGGEMGLLGLAFHPKFKENGYFYVNYTKNNPRETVISRFKAASPTASTAEPGSEVVLLKFSQPYSNHNGGKLVFGPDGYLYISTGDGGSGGDPQNNGQSRSTLLGKILRIDVNSTEKGQYGIPADNPYKGNSNNYREEIFAYGLRNPWRISFDDKGQLWAGDVGQNAIEEIDIVTKGGNYGWRVKEGNSDYNARDNQAADFVGPIWQYDHKNGDISVTGGLVYRGQAAPALRNKYVYADYASGRVWALTSNGTKAVSNQEIVARAGLISAFGEDKNKEMYLCDYDGRILKLSAGK
ncbi:glucose sorbosone dehydrogenase [Spirosoma sordidisoli]|uniref:Glucose sorbosone dehydrogenase n=2 Tax=Spirosoma sordidisoli TaxID=2502893 RepID=A0A4Q2UDS6_9BACT|nr:glucose sorbosone dehydrogenase [Spirosoma sordidisoli]